MIDTEDGHLDLPHDYHDSGWMRFTPPSAIPLFLVIGTATRRNINGSLDEFLAGFPQLPRGAEEPLIWDEDDPDENAERQDEFARCIAHVAPTPPATMRELAELLVSLGVFTHSTNDGVDKWRVTLPMPLPQDVLRLTNEQRDREDRIRWDSFVQPSIDALLNYFRGQDHPDTADTSVERLARGCGVPELSVRQGLGELESTGEFVVYRHGQPVAIAEIADHARFELRIDWYKIHCERITIHGMSENGSIEVSGGIFDDLNEC